MGNTLDFTTDSDRFVNNGPFSNSMPPTYWPSVGAISAKTAFRTGPRAGQHSNNTMRLMVKDPFFLGNSPADLLAYGAVSLDGGGRDQTDGRDRHSTRAVTRRRCE